MITRLVSLLVVLAVAGLLAALPAPRSSALPEQQLETTCVDCPRSFGDTSDRSLRLDAQGHPHVAYGGDHLYYAFRSGSTWQTEVADDTDGVGRYASLALTSAGQPRICYVHVLTCPTPPFDETCADLRFAAKDAGGWQAETVYQGGFVGSTSIAVDASGNAHIAFWDRDWAYYAYQTAAGWQAGNNLAVFMDARQTSTQYVDWRAYDYSPVSAARLIVSYQWSSGPTATPTPT